MAAEIIVVVEDKDAGGWPGGPAVEPGGREPTDAGTDHDEIVALLGRRSTERIPPALVRLRVGGLERAGMLAAQPGERGRIAHRLRRSLGRGSQAGGDGERRAVEEVASRNRGHARGVWQQSSAARKPPLPAFAARPAYPAASSPCGCGLVAARRGTISFASRTWTTSPRWLRVSLRTFTIPRSGRERGGMPSSTSLTTWSLSPGRVGFGQLISPPAPTTPPLSGNPD